MASTTSRGGDPIPKNEALRLTFTLSTNHPFRRAQTDALQHRPISGLPTLSWSSRRHHGIPSEPAANPRATGREDSNL
jgi:hypothetical protein